MFTAPIHRFRRVAEIVALLGIFSALSAPLHAQTDPAPGDPPIMPGDVIKLDVLGEEAVSGEFPVTAYFTVTLPILGELSTVDHTQLSFKRLVREQMARSVVSPAIEVTVLKRVRVLGGVMEGGVFLLDPTMSVADALAMAGGRSPQGDGSRVLLRRGGQTIEEELETGTMLAGLSIMTNDEIIVPQRSWWDRNLTSVVSGAFGVLGVAVALIR